MIICVCVFPQSQDRKEVLPIPIESRPREKLMTKNGNDRIAKLFWRKRKDTIKHYKKTFHTQGLNKRHSRGKDQSGAEWEEERNKSISQK